LTDRHLVGGLNLDERHAHRAMTTAVVDAERALLLVSAACLAAAGEIAAYGYGGILPMTGQIEFAAVLAGGRALHAPVAGLVISVVLVGHACGSDTSTRSKRMNSCSRRTPVP
jgi:hypothetical protein